MAFIPSDQVQKRTPEASSDSQATRFDKAGCPALITGILISQANEIMLIRRI
jgi:hypothetical protein